MHVKEMNESVVRSIKKVFFDEELESIMKNFNDPDFNVIMEAVTPEKDDIIFHLGYLSPELDSEDVLTGSGFLNYTDSNGIDQVCIVINLYKYDDRVYYVFIVKDDIENKFKVDKNNNIERI